MPPLSALSAVALLGVVSAAPVNLVFILVDDWGSTDVGYKSAEYDGQIRTPHLDQLATEGIKLESYHAQPICTPTRAQLLSGRYQIHTGLQNQIIGSFQANAVPLNETLISERLSAMNYSCHKVGKWHIGFYSEAYCPWRRGFNATTGGSDYGFITGSENYYTKTQGTGYDFRDNGSVDHSPGSTDYSTYLYSNRAVQIIHQHARERPQQGLFLYMPLQAVHAPLQAPQEWLDRFSHVKDSNRRTYAAMAGAMDEAVFNVTSALRETGLWQNTLLVVSGDNGGQRFHGGNNWPLRGNKGVLWDGGHKVVGIIAAGPQLLPAARQGSTFSGLLHVTDWHPTFLNLAAGHDAASGLPQLDGHDVWPALRDGSASPRTEILHNIDPLGGWLWNGQLTRGYARAAIRVGEWKLLLGKVNTNQEDVHAWYAPAGWAPSTVGGGAPYSCPAGIEVDTAIGAEGYIGLFNMSADPSEVCNLATTHPDIVDRLIRRLDYYNSTAVPVRYPEDDPAADPHNNIVDGVPTWGPWIDSPDADARGEYIL